MNMNRNMNRNEKERAMRMMAPPIEKTDWLWRSLRLARPLCSRRDSFRLFDRTSLPIAPGTAPNVALLHMLPAQLQRHRHRVRNFGTFGNFEAATRHWPTEHRRWMPPGWSPTGPGTLGLWTEAQGSVATVEHDKVPLRRRSCAMMQNGQNSLEFGGNRWGNPSAHCST